jgi:tetracycline resistance efflux pump
MDYGLFSLVPSLIAILFALLFRNVLLALLSALIIGDTILLGGNLFLGVIATIERIIALFGEAWIVKMLFFSLLVGSVIHLIESSGGVNGFVNWISSKEKLIKDKRGALLLAYGIGIVIFIESSITSLIAGSVSKPLCDKYHTSPEKLAYVCDSTSAPICSLIPFNGWGALLLGLITTQITAGYLSGDAIAILLQAVLYNFYAWSTLLFVLYIILFEKDFLLMKKVELTAKKQRVTRKTTSHIKGEAINMLLPISIMILMVPIVLYITSEGEMMKGSGSSAIFYSVLCTVLFSILLYRFNRALSFKKSAQAIWKGIFTMLPIATILLLAFAIGDLTKELETGLYIASFITQSISSALLPGLLFLLSALIAFSVGTSWGTFSIMIPIAVPLAILMQIDPALLIGAVISGGVFGDHTSPISDTTIISSMATQCDHISHVKTQLPYALISGGFTFGLFIVAGLL